MSLSFGRSARSSFISASVSLTDFIVTKVERRYIQKLLASSNKKETEFGLTYNIVKKDGKCKIICEDGMATTETLLIRGKSRTVRRIQSVHYLDRKDDQIKEIIL